MKYSKDKSYKLIEFEGGLLITDNSLTLKDPTANPLIIADAPTMALYIEHYMQERAKGTPQKEAHRLACVFAQRGRMLIAVPN